MAAGLLIVYRSKDACEPAWAELASNTMTKKQPDQYLTFCLRNSNKGTIMSQRHEVLLLKLQMKINATITSSNYCSVIPPSLCKTLIGLAWLTKGIIFSVAKVGMVMSRFRINHLHFVINKKTQVVLSAEKLLKSKAIESLLLRRSSKLKERPKYYSTTPPTKAPSFYLTIGRFSSKKLKDTHLLRALKGNFLQLRGIL
ncbi:hypothetical protein P5673_016952 [Acropora cervicornis]|uniref:Uncharacterized protein n=1 Tax=Acropora cervicornis TaxID=6130 RepID=A0AAD9QFX5_ACRCE|nr:hypothetical protein P5673_016952 [Acropora cervicornis]